MTDPAREAARKAKISATRKRKMAEQGFLNSAETRTRIGDTQRGRIMPEEHRAAISAALKGRTPTNFQEMQAIGHALPKPRGENHPSWKGDAVGYGGVHDWLRKEYGQPSFCEECGTTSAKRFEWANISLQYHRDRADYRRLCASCHRKEGFARREYLSPGVKGKQTNTGRTHFKAGAVSNPKRNYLEDRGCANCGTLFHPVNARVFFCGRSCYYEWMRGKPRGSSPAI